MIDGTRLWNSGSNTSIRVLLIVSFVIIQVQDNNLLSSETCVHFLLKLLNPPVNVVDAKAPSIGSKLLGIGKFQMLNGSNKDVDSCSEDILSKVEEILLSCKEIKPADRDYKRTTRTELCSKWLALLTMEKTCLSVVALEGKFSNQNFGSGFFRSDFISQSNKIK